MIQVVSQILIEKIKNGRRWNHEMKVSQFAENRTSLNERQREKQSAIKIILKLTIRWTKVFLRFDDVYEVI